MTTPVQGDVCPLCGRRGRYIIPGVSAQVLCFNSACDALSWDADMTLDQLLSDAHVVKLSDDAAAWVKGEGRST